MYTLTNGEFQNCRNKIEDIKIKEVNSIQIPVDKVKYINDKRGKRNNMLGTSININEIVEESYTLQKWVLKAVIILNIYIQNVQQQVKFLLYNLVSSSSSIVSTLKSARVELWEISRDKVIKLYDNILFYVRSLKVVSNKIVNMNKYKNVMRRESFNNFHRNGMTTERNKQNKSGCIFKLKNNRERKFTISKNLIICLVVSMVRIVLVKIQYNNQNAIYMKQLRTNSKLL